MVQTRKQRKAVTTDPHPIKLRQPDRTTAVPSDKTLLDLADERNLLQRAVLREKQLAQDVDAATDDIEKENQDQDEAQPSLSPRAERVLETALWTVTLAILHFTFDVLVHHQYARDMVWSSMWARTARAWSVFLFLFYFLHPYDPNAVLVPGLPAHLHRPLRQLLFFAVSLAAGCYLIHLSNTQGYLATMKQAPPLGCLWLWAVVELDLVWGCLSLLGAALFLQLGGYHLH